jgi:hypothetical protein
MKNVHSVRKPHRVDGSIRVTSVICNDFQNARTESLERLRVSVLFADLRQVERVTDFVLNVLRTRSECRQRVAEPYDWLERRLRHSDIIC